jgi:hypothetical protein
MRALTRSSARPSVAVRVMTAVALAGTANVLTGSANSSAGAQHASQWLPFSGSAPCKGDASIAVHVSHNPHVHRPDLLRVRVIGAKGHSRWSLEVEVHSGDSASVTRYPTQRADQLGKWVVHNTAGNGYTTVKATARSARGQDCELAVTGQIHTT